MKAFQLYKYCAKTLDYKPMTRRISVSVLGLTIMASTLGYLFRSYQEPKLTFEQEKLVMLLNQSENESFTPDHLYHYLRDVNVSFPDIVYAQAIIESGNFKSNIFKTNNNLFGMKVAKQRPTLALGEESGHAYYDNWKTSVIDYALFQSKYLSSIKTKQQYLDYLSQNYAEDTTYMNRIILVLKTIPKDTCVTH